MPAPTFALVQPLVSHEEIRGAALDVSFQCPVSGRQVYSSARVERTEVPRAGRRPNKGLFRSVRRSLAGVVRGAVGGGVLGNAAGEVVAGPDQSVEQLPVTDEERRAAIVAAFKDVAIQFAWDAGSRRYVAATLMHELQTDFARAVEATPVESPGDRAILARMLAEIAAADGRVGDEERDFFAAFAGAGDAELGEIDTLTRKPPLTPDDLAEATPAVREVLLMLAWALAYADEELEDRERRRLAAFAAGLGISETRAEELSGNARAYLIDQLLEVIYQDGVADADERAQVARLAARLGLDARDVEALDLRCRSRKGLT
jgi:uncharacterized tellurite resistance protein B-like protein